MWRSKPCHYDLVNDMAAAAVHKISKAAGITGKVRDLTVITAASYYPDVFVKCFRCAVPGYADHGNSRCA